MPKIEISNSKGLVQKTGEGLVAVPLSQTLTNTSLTIDTSCFYTQVDPDGNRTVDLEVALSQGESVLCVWNGSKWSPTSQTLG